MPENSYSSPKNPEKWRKWALAPYSISTTLQIVSLTLRRQWFPCPPHRCRISKNINCIAIVADKQLSHEWRDAGTFGAPFDSGTWCLHLCTGHQNSVDMCVKTIRKPLDCHWMVSSAIQPKAPSLAVETKTRQIKQKLINPRDPANAFTLIVPFLSHDTDNRVALPVDFTWSWNQWMVWNQLQCISENQRS